MTTKIPGGTVETETIVGAIMETAMGGLVGTTATTAITNAGLMMIEIVVGSEAKTVLELGGTVETGMIDIGGRAGIEPIGEGATAKIIVPETKMNGTVHAGVVLVFLNTGVFVSVRRLHLRGLMPKHSTVGSKARSRNESRRQRSTSQHSKLLAPDHLLQLIQRMLTLSNGILTMTLRNKHGRVMFLMHPDPKWHLAALRLFAEGIGLRSVIENHL